MRDTEKCREATSISSFSDTGTAEKHPLEVSRTLGIGEIRALVVLRFNIGNHGSGGGGK